jgi:hypothetical protein
MTNNAPNGKALTFINIFIYTICRECNIIFQTLDKIQDTVLNRPVYNIYENQKIFNLILY